MGRAATTEEIDETGLSAIPLTLGDPDVQEDNLDLIGDGDDDEVDPVITLLQEQMEQLQTSQKEEREFLQNTILEMSQRPAQVVAAPAANNQPAATIALDFKDLPDPVENRDDFNRELGTRVSKFVNDQSTAMSVAVTSQNQTQAGLQDLENRFTRDHAELAKKPALFQATVTQEVAKIKNRGLNPQTFIFADPDKFLSLVAQNMKDELGIEDEDEEDDDGDNVVKLKGSKKTSRTKGVKSGSMPILKKSGKDTGKKPLSMVKEIKKSQHAMGLI